MEHLSFIDIAPSFMLFIVISFATWLHRDKIYARIDPDDETF